MFLKKNAPLLVCLIFSSIFGSISQAEYRAFLLKISGGGAKPEAAVTGSPPATSLKPTNPTESPTTTDFRLVKSNLDEGQYPYYYPLAPDETISELETWMCRGRTGGFQEICENPNTPRAPASQEATPVK